MSYNSQLELYERAWQNDYYGMAGYDDYEDEEEEK